MKRHEYIKKHANELNKLCVKRSKISERCLQGTTPKMAQKLNAELNFLGMEISKTEERLAYALGYLLPENATIEYNPSAFHRYKGIREELEKTKFDI